MSDDAQREAEAHCRKTRNDENMSVVRLGDATANDAGNARKTYDRM